MLRRLSSLFTDSEIAPADRVLAILLDVAVGGPELGYTAEAVLRPSS